MCSKNPKTTELNLKTLSKGINMDKDLIRLKKVRDFLKKSDCDALLVEDPINLFYLSGFSLSSGKMVVKENEVFLLVDNRYYDMCKNRRGMTILLSDHTPLEMALNNVSRLAFDGETTSYKNYVHLETRLKNLRLVSFDNPVQKIRSVKDPDEISLMTEAAQLGVQGYHLVKDLLHDAVSEMELAAELEIFWKRKGGQGVAFEPIIAFGENSAIPHHRAGETRLKSGMTVLIDIGVKWKKYHSDMTRTLFWGEPPAVMRKIYDIVQEAQLRALELCKSGTLLGDLDAAARDYIASKGYRENFLHSLGHGVGLEIHEWPLIRKKEPFQYLPLEAGMVVTIEPGIYLPGIGGVRIEDTVVITSNGYENISKTL